MICVSCRDGRHDECPALAHGGSWCDCQHLTGPATPEARRRDAAAPTSDRRSGEAGDGAAAEPGVNWKRQG